MNEVQPVEGRRRRRTFSQKFRDEVIECCQRLGVSVAAVARAYDLHPNLLRRWLTEHEKCSQESSTPAQGGPTLPASAPQPQNAFVPVGIPRPPPAAVAEVAECRDIRIELHHRGMTANVTWPVAAAEQCATWLHRLMR